MNVNVNRGGLDRHFDNAWASAGHRQNPGDFRSHWIESQLSRRSRQLRTVRPWIVPCSSR